MWGSLPAAEREMGLLIPFLVALQVMRNHDFRTKKKPNQFLLRLIISARSREEVNGEGLNTTSGEQET